LDGSSIIKKLSLYNGDVGDASPMGSFNLPNLTALRLEKTGITSVPPLHKFPELAGLYLPGNKIDKEGFTRLNEYLASDSCQLELLNLCDTGMADEDISSLTRALKHNRSVIGLHLTGNACGAAGYRSILKMLVDISSIEATLESNTCLREIKLPKENDANPFYDQYDSDSDGSEYYSRDGFEEVRNWIKSVLRWNRYGYHSEYDSDLDSLDSDASKYN